MVACPPRLPIVLLVDNDLYVRQALAVMLKRLGCEVWLASSGPEALELYRQHPGSIDMVLLDVRMPGMSGPATLDALRQFNPRVR
jgi:CheY-like chemotaxis protein